MKLGKLREAEYALTGGNNISQTLIPNDAVGLHLLGTICRKQNQRTRAAFCFKKSLEINPFLWCSYQSLCEIGEDVPADVYFGAEGEVPTMPEPTTKPQPQPTAKLQTTKSQTASTPQPQPLSTPQQQAQPQPQPTNTYKHQSKERNIKAPPAPPVATRQASRTKCISTPQLAGRIVQRLYESPLVQKDDSLFSTQPLQSFKLNSNVLFGLNDTTTPVSSTPNAEPVRREPDALATPTFKKVLPPVRGKGKNSRSRLINQTPSGNDLKLSTNLFKDIDSTPSARDPISTPIQVKPLQFGFDTPQTREPSVSQSRLARPLFSLDIPTSNPREVLPLPNLYVAMGATESTAEETTTVDESTGSCEDEEDDATTGTAQVLTLLRVMGNGLRNLCYFRCRSAIEEFDQLSNSQHQTGWVLCRIGKAYSELSDYINARKVFEKVRELEPYRTDHMELYSTVLWQLGDSVALSYLAHQLTELNSHCPETWCAVGNCFSLQKEHETALKFFKRASTVDPSFPYSHTLSGHEYIASENWDKALACFRTAISLDERHYNAWYGLGTIYFRQQKYTIAEYHFDKAITINPRNSVLYCYSGMVLQARKMYPEAIKMLESALRIDPKNTMAKFKKAAVLVNWGKYDAALKEIKELQALAPREAPLYLLMGKIRKKQGKLSKALECFTMASDFDTKSVLSRKIKAAINKVGVPDEDDDIEAEKDDDEEIGEL
eukprot:TRINITY_DN5405_c0_g1_i4.p1 TRINITY_DN5405_c0_g1~~TRINITY_DN5405_c0_g1_i4.p1  ORF type:complete len:810 (+),score=150.42 TRINITY_DN5405_c0_g1_i4:274-2430(+)